MKVSVGAVRETCWNKKAEEMETANNAGNVRRLFQLIRATGPRKASVSKTIKNKLGTIITNKEERLDRWAEYFEEQCNWSPSTGVLDLQTVVEPWAVNLDSPTLSEIRECICSLKRHREPGPNVLHQLCSKMGAIPSLVAYFTCLHAYGILRPSLITGASQLLYPIQEVLEMSRVTTEVSVNSCHNEAFDILDTPSAHGGARILHTKIASGIPAR